MISQLRLLGSWNYEAAQKVKQIEMNFLIKIRSFIFLGAFSQQKFLLKLHEFVK